MKRRRVTKQKKYVITLSEREVKRLGCYATAHSITRPMALHKMVSSALRDVDVNSYASQIDTNQLRLFDNVQIDIFSVIDKENTNLNNNN